MNNAQTVNACRGSFRLKSAYMQSLSHIYCYIALSPVFFPPVFSILCANTGGPWRSSHMIKAFYDECGLFLSSHVILLTVNDIIKYFGC